MAGILFPKLRGWFKPAVDEDPQPAPAPVPPVAPPVEPEVPVVKPSAISVINYVRVLAILRKLPIAKFRAEWAKLPKKQIALLIGTFIWLYMTYTYATAILNWLR